MTGQKQSAYGQIVEEAADVTVDVASIGAGLVVETSIAVANALPGDTIRCTPLGVWNASLVDGGARCSVAGTVLWRVFNPTAGAIDPVSQTVRVMLNHTAP